jgi:hypothetical protein
LPEHEGLVPENEVAPIENPSLHLTLRGEWLRRSPSLFHWRGRERSVVFDARSLRWLQRVVRKQLEEEMYSPDAIEEQVNVGEIAGVRGRLVRVARQSALPELRAALEGLGFTCYEVDGSRIVDRRSFEDETARAGIFDEWEFLLRDRSAILWLAADQLFELNPIALLEAVHGLLSEWTEREQIELFLLGEGRLVEAPRVADLDSHRAARGGPSDGERLSSFLFTLGFNCELLKQRGLWNLKLERPYQALDAEVNQPSGDPATKRATLAKLVAGVESVLDEHGIVYTSALSHLEDGPS